MHNGRDRTVLPVADITSTRTKRQHSHCSVGRRFIKRNENLTTKQTVKCRPNHTRHHFSVMPDTPCFRLFRRQIGRIAALADFLGSLDLFLPALVFWNFVIGAPLLAVGPGNDRILLAVTALDDVIAKFLAGFGSFFCSGCNFYRFGGKTCTGDRNEYSQSNNVTCAHGLSFIGRLNGGLLNRSMNSASFFIICSHKKVRPPLLASNARRPAECSPNFCRATQTISIVFSHLSAFRRGGFSYADTAFNVHTSQ